MKLCLGVGHQSEAENRGGRYSTNANQCSERMWHSSVKRAADAPWYIKNSMLHQDQEIPSISKFMKDASERFFDIASSHLNPLLVSAVSYEPPPLHHFCRIPLNVLLDPPDDLTVGLENLIELNKMAID
ncbi:hypothetical protein EVAR_11907_1 [Eumeta japonica]|uniref:Uncharacterized protein n=1 Tax=Eumeta variegata TaxID=151549 RepID=A0A4C1U7S9_EUMVA|nr:hypothetical protein EVAR_11907_1 [Eumeta japonica]